MQMVYKVNLIATLIVLSMIAYDWRIVKFLKNSCNKWLGFEADILSACDVAKMQNTLREFI